MTSYKPAQIFANFSANVPPAQENKVTVTKDENKEEKIVKDNHIQVTANAEATLQPDLCRVTVVVTSSKDSVQEVKNSVSRRLDYILQTFYNHNVKESDTSVTKTLSRTGSFYKMESAVTATFMDFIKCQTVCNFLVEKLDENVTVCPPEYFHSPQRLEGLRKQTCLMAVRNVKQKASEIAGFLNQAIGRPVMIREDQCEEWEGLSETTPSSEAPITVQQRITNATVTVNVKVTACFELKSKVKGKSAK